MNLLSSALPSLLASSLAALVLSVVVALVLGLVLAVVVALVLDGSSISAGVGTFSGSRTIVLTLICWQW
ncbi:CNT_collapsed_G0025770.mRNA.1.CDS.1 [Saccharomyces cerevisiae]|nr:CNT_collapsed_G0025770.mRNA.1.CDS.1 [Saccharomyces cerevisiae]